MSNKVTITETFNMKQEALYKMWVTKEGMTKFFDASAADNSKVSVGDLKVDLKVGGKWSFIMGKGGLHHGVYKELTPFSKIVFSWDSAHVSNTQVTITFKSKGDKTECTLTHELLPEEWVDAHNKGWTQIFKLLHTV